MNTYIQRRGALQFKLRNDTLDEYMLNEALMPREYVKPMQLRRGDVVLDIGMNIGGFSIFADFIGAKLISYEPDPSNYEIACDNIELNNSKVKAYNKAVADKSGTISFYINTLKNRGVHSIIPTNGRKVLSVECEDINEILKRESPNKIKIDCEGAEYSIIKAVKEWGSVRLIRMEWHRKMLKDESNEKLDEVWDILLHAGFRIKGKRNGRGWVQMLTAERA